METAITPFWQIGLVPIGRISDILHIPSRGISSERTKGNFHTILMARLTRIAVNLLLIVAITIQPTTVRALQKACSGDCSSQFTCQGCGSCEVESPAGRCGCCSGHSDVGSNEESNEEIASCCGHGSATEHGIASKFEDDPFADMEMANGPAADHSLLRCADDQLATFANSPLVVSGCRCLHAPEVPLAPAPRSTKCVISSRWALLPA